MIHDTPQGAPPAPQEAPPAPQEVDPTQEQAVGPETEEANVSPEEQKAYDTVMVAAMDVVYGDKTHDQIMQALNKGGQASQALAKVAITIVLEIDNESQGKVPESVVIPAAMDVLDIVAEVAEKSQIFEVDEGVVMEAQQQVMVGLIEEYGVNKEDATALMGSFDKETIEASNNTQHALAQGWATEGGKAGSPAEAAPPADAGSAQPEQPGGMMAPQGA